MSEAAGEKTEQATPKRLEEAIQQGQIARSAEVQTALVLLAAMLAVKTSGAEIWRQMLLAHTSVLGHMHDTALNVDILPRYALQASVVVAACAGPIVLAAMVGGLVAGAVQNRFQLAGDALEWKWERLNPIAGWTRIFSMHTVTQGVLAVVKIAVIGFFTAGHLRELVNDPIFYTPVDMARITEFLGKTASSLTMRVLLAVSVLAALDYAYQFWHTQRSLMMTKEEVKEEMKNQEGDPQMKARQRRRRTGRTQRQMLADVPKADVIVTNPTRLAIALRYDRKNMRAPMIVAKGSRLNAQRIREIAAQHQVPVVQNVPLARLMFKYGRVGSEIPAQLYAAVAEVLAYVYRINRFRYYREQVQT